MIPLRLSIQKGQANWGGQMWGQIFLLRRSPPPRTVVVGRGRGSSCCSCCCRVLGGSRAMTTTTTTTSTTDGNSHSTSSATRQWWASVALLGPPNAGKSTLFNRMTADSSTSTKHIRAKNKKISGRLMRSATATGRQLSHVRGTAIVSSVPGTTRDVKSGQGQLAGVDFHLLDTAGIDASLVSSASSITASKDVDDNAGHSLSWMRDAVHQTTMAARQADVVFLLVDGQLPRLTSDVHETASRLRKLSPKGVPERVVRVLVNKMESMTMGQYPDVMEEAENLGFGEPIPISALHGDGMAEIAAIIQDVNDAKKKHYRESSSVTIEHVVMSDHRNSVPRRSDPTGPLVLAVLGRVNVGKSTLVNQLVELGSKMARGGNENRIDNFGDEALSTAASTTRERSSSLRKVVTGPTPGLTRDSIRLSFEWKPNQWIEVVDTAGIRKALQQKPLAAATESDHDTSSTSSNAQHHHQHQHPDLEAMAIQEAFHACKTAHVVALVIDAGAKMLHRSELAMCDAVLKEGRALLVVANKMDLVVEPGYSANDFAHDVRDQLEARFPLLRKTPVVPVSALSGTNVDKLLPVAWNARERWQQRITTPRLNRWIRDVQALHSPPSVAVRRGPNGKKKSKATSASSSTSSKTPAKIKYMLQTRERPPTFMLYCNTDSLPDRHLRFLTRHFQDTFQFYGMPVRLSVRRS